MMQPKPLRTLSLASPEYHIEEAESEKQIINSIATFVYIIIQIGSFDILNISTATPVARNYLAIWMYDMYDNDDNESYNESYNESRNGKATPTRQSSYSFNVNTFVV